MATFSHRGVDYTKKAALAGDKLPEWGCKQCGTNGNWAKRLSCRQCHEWNATTRMRSAIDNHLRLKAAKAKGGGGSNQGQKGIVDKRVADLERQLAKSKSENGTLKKQLSDASKDSPGEGTETVAEEVDEVAKHEKDLKALEATIEQQRSMGIEPSEQAQKMLDSLRLARDEAKAAKPVNLKKLHWKFLDKPEEARPGQEGGDRFAATTACFAG